MERVYKKIRYIAGCILLLTSVTGFGQSGIVVTKRAAPRGIVSFSSSSVLTGINNAKHIDGYVKKNGTTSFLFPVGDNGIYRPFAAAGDGTTGAYFLENANGATIPSGGPFLIVSKDATLSSVSNREFWDIDGTNASRITLTWNAASGISALTENNITRVTIAGYNTTTSKWEKINSTLDVISILGGSSTVSAGSITTSASLVPNTYSIYTLAAVPTDPLPVTLISFSATKNDADQVLLKWSTSFESNSKQFDIQHSTDGKAWVTKGTVDASGESKSVAGYQFIDSSPNAGENLYRLKMLDKDETFAYSRITSVKIDGLFETAFYPNPVSEKLYLKTAQPNKVREVNVRNSAGNLVFNSPSIPVFGIDVTRFNSGIYLIQVILIDGSSSSHKIFVTK